MVQYRNTLLCFCVQWKFFEFGSWIEKGTVSVWVSVVLPVRSHEYLDGTPKHTHYGCFVRSPCLQGMSRPQVAGGQDNLQMWKVPLQNLNKPSSAVDRGSVFWQGVGRWTENFWPSKKMQLHTERYIVTRSLSESVEQPWFSSCNNFWELQFMTYVMT
jgi:hypothetical protein